MNKLTTEKFIKKATLKYGNKYDYSLVNYINTLTKVKIICPIHGVFEQIPRSHLTGLGCDNCGGTAKLNTYEFIKKATVKHGNKYDYSLVDYSNSHKKVKIKCKIHGVFEQIAADHLNGCGCKLCGRILANNKTRKTTEDFIKKATLKHGNKYDYSLVDYKDIYTKVKIICPIHGVFEQQVGNHKRGVGCPTCATIQTGKLHRNECSKFIQNANITHSNKYDYSLVNYINSLTKVKIICPIHGEFEQRPDAHVTGAGCPTCGELLASNNKIKNYKFIELVNKIHNNKYDYSLVNYKKNILPVKIICPIHGEFEQSIASHLRGHGCQKCANQFSKYENYIEDFLKKYHINYQKHFRINNVEADFYIKDKQLGIEVDGLYWHSEIQGKDRNYHLNKTNLYKNNNIQLIHIFENEFIFKKQIVKSRLKHIFGLIKQSIYARKCEIKEIEAKLKNKFLNKYHLQGEDKSCVKLGLFYKNRLVSVMTFSKLRKALGQIHKENYYELSRFCSINNFNVVGGASKLLAYFEQNYTPEKIITYADRRWSKGDLYYKLGFKLDHTSSPSYWYFDRKCNYYHRFNFRKNVLKDKLKIFDPNLSEWENMKNNGWNRIWDCGNYMFIKTI